MAPVKAASLGILPQTIDDLELSLLIKNLNELSVKTDSIDDDKIERLVALVDKYPEWTFEEQVDLFEWIPTLNSIDALITHFVEAYPSLLLVAPVERKVGISVEKPTVLPSPKFAISKDDKAPQKVVSILCSILSFVSRLLRNSTNKHVFNSVEEIVDLLGAADDSLATLALQTLANLAAPPALHKQQAPEGHQHTSALHSSKSQSHKRLVALARGWGSRGSGLGLFACVTADDSQHFDLPTEAGEVRFEFFAPVDASMDVDGKAIDNSKLVSIHLTTKDIVTVPINSSTTMETKQKRQRLEDIHPNGMLTKSTTELFFSCLDAAGGRDRIPEDRLFVLLSDIRLAKCFHSSESRLAAVESRILALIAILYAHPSQEIMSGYFQAQPELCVELIDLLRSTVSSGTVSAASAKPGRSIQALSLQSLTALASPPEVAYSVRNLAVEALTALVARRDGASGGLTGVARQSNILNELGVGKGMYLGLLPTLVRYSLASLTNFLSSGEHVIKDRIEDTDSLDDIALDVGLAFLDASKAPTISAKEHVTRALAFVDNVLSLTSAVVSAPSGTAALTDCGIIPALLSTVALDSKTVPKALSNLKERLSEYDQSRIQSQVRFIASQAIQIIEGAIATHNNALSAFHDLKGVEILIKRLQEEIHAAKDERLSDTASMEIDDKEGSSRKLLASRRVLLFSIVNCLTVVFHQESSSTTTPSGGAQLRNPELTFVITEVMDHVNSYGGILAALTSSLLSDVMNSDPHVVYHVHTSGMAKAFFGMMSRGKIIDGAWEPEIPPVPELIMALPNVIAALSLTSDGASHVKEANPFPSLLKVLFHPKYAMPRSRCLLNEMTAIVGTGLDEVMRHVPSLRVLVMESIVESMKGVINFGKSIVEREEKLSPPDEQGNAATALENERTCLIQYTLNLGQMLEQILHTEDHCDPFVQAGGLTAILDLFPLLVPPTTQFLANVSCISSPSVCTLAHTTTEDSLSVSFRCIAINYDSQKMLKVLMVALDAAMNQVDKTEGLLRSAFPSTHSEVRGAFGVLEGLPSQALHELRGHSDHKRGFKCLADYLRAIVTLQWQTNLLAIVVRAACQRIQDGGTGWGHTEREWKKELSSHASTKLMFRIAEYHHSAVLESCRIRSEDGFEEDFRKRHLQNTDSGMTLQYRLRIVCQEGAVVRDGIEIDSCANVGSMEMGQVTNAYERCVNSSGVMRYRTRRGWVSELTRGHGREPIAEVMDVSTIDINLIPKPAAVHAPKKRMEYHIASFRSVGASILARLQTSYRDLITSLSRVVSNGIRSLTVTSVDFNSPGTVGFHTCTLLDLLSSGLSMAMNQESVVAIISGKETTAAPLNNAGVAMYLGTVLGIISSSLYEDKRERRTVNVALLLSLLNNDHHIWTKVTPRLSGKDVDMSRSIARVGIFDAIRFIMEYSLRSPQRLLLENQEHSKGGKRPTQTLDRVAAASLPPVIALLRRLMGGLSIKQSPVTSILDRLELFDLSTLIGGSKESPVNQTFCRLDDGELKFSPERFVRGMHFAVAEIVLDVWKDTRFKGMPPHVVYPMTTLSIEVIGGLEDAVKPSPASGGGVDGRLLFRRASRAPVEQAIPEEQQNEAQVAQEQFAPSEDTITRLTEMGFTREHALDAIESTESNQWEVAFEHALSHPPPSPGTIQRRREQRGQLRQQLEAFDNNEQAQGSDAVMDDSGDAASVDSDEAVSGKAAKEKEAAQKEDESRERVVLEKVRTCLDDWIDSSPAVAIGLLAGAQTRTLDATSQLTACSGDGDTEALTVVVCSFLISLCQKYPNKTDEIVEALLSKLRSNFVQVEDDERGYFAVAKGFDTLVASLCHAVVLFGRAIPKTRTMVLDKGLVSCLMSCLRQFAASLDDGREPSEFHWPVWVTSGILLLDLMAQPLVAFSDSNGSKDEEDEKQDTGTEHADLELVRSEHRLKAKALSDMASQLFSVVENGEANETEASKSRTPQKVDDQSKSDKVSTTNNGNLNISGKRRSPFSVVPPFYPLIPDETARSAIAFCLCLLGKDAASTAARAPPPGTVHAILLLMTRLVRSSTLAAECLKDGVPNLILALPRKCRFNGNTGLVTVILRRLLEDETNLKISMETEIRSVLAKLHRKQNRQVSSTNEEHTASMTSFLQAVTPLLCRDPVTFLKAALSTVSFDSKKTSNGQRLVRLIPSDKRQRVLRIISSFKFNGELSGHGTDDKSAEVAKRGKSVNQKASRGKSPHRSSLTRRGSFSKKGKKEKGDRGLNGTPSNHVMSLLIEKIIAQSSLNLPSLGHGRKFGEDDSFLWVADILEIMADLVLAVPACAAAIHRFRSSSGKSVATNDHPLSKISHALAGCPVPPPTVVSFLLHSLLPQDRWSYRQDQDGWDKRGVHDDARKVKNKDSYMRTRVAQTTARLLVSLVARAGEGRRRVVADLSYALSGGHQKGAGSDSIHERSICNPSTSDEFELFALQAWGDLCIGLAAPRSNGVNHDNNSNLSYEVVKLMLEFKMAHSLIYAVGRVNLKHPMAAATCGSLLVPLEVFTRPSVSDAVQALADKEEGERENILKATDSQVSSRQDKKGKQTGLTRGVSLGPSQRIESAFADDAMLAEGFDADFAQQNEVDDDDDDDGDDEVLMEVVEDGDIDEDVEMVDESDDEEGDEDEDSDNGDEDSDSDGDEESEGEEEDEDEEDDDGDEEDIEDDMDPGAGAWEEEVGEFLEGDEEEDIEEGDQDRANDLIDDWDQIEAPSFGGMMRGVRRGTNISNRARGFVDAAEAMIGSLLRTGEIQGDALAEIEGTLGIRIGGANRNLPDWANRARSWGSPSDERPWQPGQQRPGINSGSVENNIMGTVPHVNQRRPPDVGPSAGGRWNDISSMEFVFGGPTLTGGSRNFDVVSELQTIEVEETYASPSAVDSQLFPGGPAASTHARTQQPFHPLLCGVDLPPMNSLVSDLMSHGERSTRRVEISARRNDDWSPFSMSSGGAGGYIVSTSNGNLMRISRGPGGGPATLRPGTIGLAGWTADGQPPDGTVTNFSSAFENAISETIDEQIEAVETGAAAALDANIGERGADPAQATTELMEEDRVENTESGGEVERSSLEEDDRMRESHFNSIESNQIRSAEAFPTVSDSMIGIEEEPLVLTGASHVAEAATSQIDNARESGTTGGSSNPSDMENQFRIIDGDGVASSLVEGLHLSDSGGRGSDDVEEDFQEVIDDSIVASDEPTTDHHEATANNREEEINLSGNEPNSNGLVCPPGMDLEVFNSLPLDMQREVVEQHQATIDLAAQLDAASGLDPEALAALPEDMRREVIAQEQRERRLREAPADPSNAEDMDNASFVASLAPELRREILLTGDEGFLNSLPPDIIAEAQLLRERASHQHRRLQDPVGHSETAGGAEEGNRGQAVEDGNGAVSSSRKKQRYGKIKVDCDRLPVLFMSGTPTTFPTEPFGAKELKCMIQLMFLLSPVRPQRLLQKVFQNICTNPSLRNTTIAAFTRLLNDDSVGTASTVEALSGGTVPQDEQQAFVNVEFPPRSLIGAAPEVLDSGGNNPSSMFFRRRQGSSCAASIAASLPTALIGSSKMRHIPPVVSTRVIDTLSFLGKNSPRVCLDVLTSSTPAAQAVNESSTGTCFEQMLDLLQNPRYIKSSTNLEHLLSMIEIMIYPLASLSRSEEEDAEVTQKEIDAAAANGKEWVDVPRVAISQSRLQLLCSILKMESCRDAAFTKVNGITRRLCKVEANRGHVLGELASVAQALGEDAKRDLRALLVRMNDAVAFQQKSDLDFELHRGNEKGKEGGSPTGAKPSSTVTLSSSSSELKLLRVLQTLQSLCSENLTDDSIRRKDIKVFVTPELIEILQGINLNDLWQQLSACLKVVRVLEGISTVDEKDEKNGDNDEDLPEDNGNAMEETGDEGSEGMVNAGKKLQNSSAGLLTRFLPAIEAFFVVNASTTREEDTETSTLSSESKTPEKQNEGRSDDEWAALVGGKRVIDFVSENKVILNALVRNNAGLLERGLRPMVQVPRCRVYLDFDVKRQWFKTQIRRLRQHASRRHGSLRLGIRRKYVFEDAYHQLRLRNADEMRSRLQITFRNEEGVDAGGLSREFFGILAKEMFNPNYALFTSTEDGCTFQPNPNSSINPDHLSYLRFVGRIVGKAVADGFLLDAHFTRSLYKHMLGMEPTHHDMEAIDPDYYKNLKMILEYSLTDIGLELTFSIEDHSFGRSQVIDLIPDGRSVPVTDETKAKYVSLVCKHRMTTSIKSQIKAYLDGFYELVSPDLIAIFTPRELELLISGLPDIDVHDLKKNTDYQGWKATDPEIEWFWNVMFSLSRSEKAAFLQFVTGSSKVPLAGFAELQGMRGVQKFSIHKAGGTNGALMSAHTCFNSLDLPKYDSQEEMKEKLLYAISEGQGSFQFA